MYRKLKDRESYYRKILYKKPSKDSASYGKLLNRKLWKDARSYCIVKDTVKEAFKRCKKQLKDTVSCQKALETIPKTNCNFTSQQSTNRQHFLDHVP